MVSKILEDLLECLIIDNWGLITAQAVFYIFAHTWMWLDNSGKLTCSVDIKVKDPRNKIRHLSPSHTSGDFPDDL